MKTEHLYQGGDTPQDGDTIKRVSLSTPCYPSHVGVLGEVVSVRKCTPGNVVVDDQPGYTPYRFKLISRKEHPKEMVRCVKAENAPYLQAGAFYLIIANDGNLVKIAEHQNTWFSRDRFGPVVATDRCGEYKSDDFKSHYLKAMDYAKQLEADVVRWKNDYGDACAQIAKMHAAAVGYVGGPKRGVVEDVEDLRSEMLRAKSELNTKTWNYNNAMDSNRALIQQIKTMKERFDRIRVEAQL